MPPSIEDEIRQLRALFWSDRDPEGCVFAPLADAYRRAGDLEQAISLLDEGLVRQRDFAPGYVVAGWVRRDRGEDDAAALAFRAALALDPENAEAQQALTELRATEVDEVASDEPDAAVQPAASGPAPSGPVTRTMADLYARQGLNDRALAVYRQLLERDPADAGLRARIAELEGVTPGARREADVEKLARDWAEGPRVTGDLSTPFAWAPKLRSQPQRSGPAAHEYFRGLLSWEPGSVPPPTSALAPEAGEAVAEAAAVDEVIVELESPAAALDTAPEEVVAIDALSPDAIPITSLAPAAVPIASLAPVVVPIASLAPDPTGEENSGWNTQLQ